MRMPLAVALLALLTQSATPPATVSQSARTKDGYITVTVVDAVTHSPIGGARVTFIFFQTPPPNVVTYVNSDANGQAVFKDLAEGRYGIGADRDGYVSPPTAALNNAIEINTA